MSDEDIVAAIGPTGIGFIDRHGVYHPDNPNQKLTPETRAQIQAYCQALQDQERKLLALLR